VVSTHMAKGLVVGVLSIAIAAQQLMAANPQSLAGSEWRPVEISGEAIADDAPLFVRFEAEGKMAGHGGCNRMFGSYTIDNVNLRIGPLGGTRMACLPAIMKREAAFMRALQNSCLFLRDGTKPYHDEKLSGVKPGRLLVDPIFQPAMEAAKRGDLEGFVAVLDANSNILKESSSTGHPSLAQFVGVDGGLGAIPQPRELVDLLLGRGVPPDSIIVPAASVNADTIVDALMDAGASIEVGAPWTALEEALYWQHTPLARHLIEKHAAKISSLRAAAQLGLLDLMKSYFEPDGALSLSAGQVVYPFGAVCAEAGAILNQALFLALRHLQFEAAEELLRCGANLNTIVMGHHEHCAPLHQAVYLDQQDTIDWLLERGARADIIDPRFNGSPIDWADHFDRTEIARQLEQAAPER
jgi:heat shock protein HslJ